MDRDKDAVEQVITELESPQNIRRMKQYYDLRPVYFSFPGMAYAKLAWMKGLEVEIDSPYIIKELLPVQPNETYYDEYDFLKELDVPLVSQDSITVIPLMEVGTYPDKNPSLRSPFVSQNTVAKVISHFALNIVQPINKS